MKYRQLDPKKLNLGNVERYERELYILLKVAKYPHNSPDVRDKSNTKPLKMDEV